MARTLPLPLLSSMRFPVPSSAAWPGLAGWQHSLRAVSHCSQPGTVSSWLRLHSKPLSRPLMEMLKETELSSTDQRCSWRPAACAVPQGAGLGSILQSVPPRSAHSSNPHVCHGTVSKASLGSPSPFSPPSLSASISRAAESRHRLGAWVRLWGPCPQEVLSTGLVRHRHSRIYLLDKSSAEHKPRAVTRG